MSRGCDAARASPWKMREAPVPFPISMPRIGVPGSAVYEQIDAQDPMQVGRLAMDSPAAAQKSLQTFSQVGCDLAD